MIKRFTICCPASLALILCFSTVSLYSQPNSYDDVTPLACNQSQFAKLKRDAARGHKKEQKELGDAYASGRCVPTDNTKATYWYRRSAKKGNADAQFALAMFLLEGKEIAQNTVEAASWFRRAAEKDHSGAQYALGSLCIQGRGLAKDIEQGYKWIRVSSPSLDRHTKDVLAEIAKNMNQVELERAEKAASLWRAAHDPQTRKDEARR